MTGWLIVNGFLHSEKFDELTELFAEAAKEKEITLLIKSNVELLIDTKFKGMEKPDFVLFWDKDILLAKSLEAQGLRLYNSSHAIAVCDDKRDTHIALQKAGIPAPRTIIAPMTYDGIGFCSLSFLSKIEQRLSFPLVVKEAFGSFGEQVYLVENHTELLSLVSKCGTTKLLFQEYISYSRGRDLRLQVVGEQVVAAILRHSDSDFRANITAGGKMESYVPSREEKELALQAARAVGADFAGVDLLFGSQGPLVCEVNSNAHFKNLLTCTGKNTAEEILRYICYDIACSSGNGGNDNVSMAHL